MDNTHRKVLVFLTLVFQLAAPVVDSTLGIDCDATDDLPGCGYQRVCRVTCERSCKDATKEIWGTAQYTYGSAVCTAAAHDGRLNPWDPNTWTVDLVLRKGGVDVFRGSTRQGISSMSYRYTLTDFRRTWYEFVSPRIAAEPLADITSVHLNYRHPNGADHEQFCFTGGLHNRDVVFEPFVNPRREYYRPRQQRPGVYSIAWSSSRSPEVVTGGFTCSVEGTVLSRVTSVATVNHGSVHPEQLSLTINAGQSTTLSNPSGQPVQWTKDGGTIGNQRLGQVSVQDAQLGDGGLYVMDFGSGVRQALRLIVRSCPKDLYGRNCEASCPPCQNGGVCHDITGVCVCPPGFFGEHCQDHCTETGFGQNCSHDCRTVQPGHRTDCSRLLFCLPDPYGCSCYPGFGGLDCSRPCSGGTYGADCKQRRTCFCQDGRPCHPKWGFCPDRTCWPGFRDPPYCDRSYPVLRNISVYAPNDNSLEVTWQKWDPHRDEGVGHPRLYRVQYRVSPAARSATWQEAGIVNHAAMPRGGAARGEIVGLLPNSAYDVRVVIEDHDGNANERLAPVRTAATRCGRPLRPPHNITADSSTVGIIAVTWKIPEKITWQCPHISIQISVNNNAPRDAGNTGRYTFGTPPFTTYSIRLRTVTEQLKTSDWSPELRVTSAEEAPSQVGEITVARISPKTYNVTWSRPEKVNGIIRGYEILLRMEDLLSPCRAVTFPQPTVVNVPAHQTVYFFTLTPAAKYVISVAAWTVQRGVWAAKRFTSEEEVPDGAPRNIVVSGIKETSARITWNEPDCSLTNGKILTYHYSLRTNASWHRAAASNSTRKRMIDFLRLTPFTYYEVEVSAWNGAGGGPSVSAGFTTEPDVPLAPTNLTVYSTAYDHVSISWLPPYPPTGEVEMYDVFYKPKAHSTYRSYYRVSPDDSRCNVAILPGHQCFTFRTLAPNTEYDIYVTAKNKLIGVWSERSKVITAVTTESTPGPPVQLSQETREDTTFTVSWKEPVLSNGIVVGYRITVTQMVDNETSPAFLSSDTAGAAVFSYAAINLRPGSAYNVTVEAATALGYGEPASILAYTRAPVLTLKVRPRLKAVQKNSVTVTLTSAPKNDDVKHYYVIVEKLKTRRKRSTESSLAEEWINGKVDYNASVAGDLPFYVAAELSPSEVESSPDFTVGDGRYYGPYYNAPLTRGNRYRIGMAAEVQFNGDSRMSYVPLAEPVEIEEEDTTAVSSAVTAVTVILLLALLLGIATVALRGQHYFSRKLRFLRSRTEKNETDESSTAEFLDETDNPDIEMEEVTSVSAPSTTALPVSELWDYVQRMMICDGLRHEYLSIPAGQLYPAEEAKRPENKAKNRYRNRLPYDHSRVTLQELEGVSCSDYINASYIDGYKTPRKYIATQGPKPGTVVDFWRMIWQYNVCKIVMLTNTVERGQTKCEKYWPDKATTYGDIVVRLMSTESFPDHDINQFHVTKAETTREVKQFHMKTWPDHGEPLYPSTLLAFHKKVCAYRAYNEAPTVVHCSAGIGRTGTYILFDILREQAMAENAVSIPSQLHTMRKNRMNMVETLEQYNFVHRAIAESTSVGDYCIPTPQFQKHHSQLFEIDAETGNANLAGEFEEVNRLKPRFVSSDFTDAYETENFKKNRDGNILAPNGGRPFLKDGTFINAVYVDGMYRKNIFLVTKTPSKEGIEDFWKMVVESETRTIVTLDVFTPDSVVVPFWPTSTAVRYGDVKIECTDTQVDDVLCVQTFKIGKRTKGQHFGASVTLKHFHLTKWNEPHIMISLVDFVERWQRQSDNKIIVVQCRDGCSASGVFCCSMLVLGKIKSEQEVDVFLATRVIRSNRPQLIKNIDQYEFCYNVANAYLHSFDTYANL